MTKTTDLRTRLFQIKITTYLKKNLPYRISNLASGCDNQPYRSKNFQLSVPLTRHSHVNKREFQELRIRRATRICMRHRIDIRCSKSSSLLFLYPFLPIAFEDRSSPTYRNSHQKVYPYILSDFCAVIGHGVLKIMIYDLGARWLMI